MKSTVLARKHNSIATQRQLKLDLVQIDLEDLELELDRVSTRLANIGPDCVESTQHQLRDLLIRMRSLTDQMLSTTY